MEMYKRITNSNKFTKMAVSKSLNSCVFNNFTGIISSNNFHILKNVLVKNFYCLFLTYNWIVYYGDVQKNNKFE